MSQWLVNTTPTFRLDIGAASVGAVTVDITRGDGTLLIDDGATTDNSDGTYDYTLAVGSNTQLDQLRLDWTITGTSNIVTTYEEIVGSTLFTVEEARAFSAKADAAAANIPLNSATEYPDATIIRERGRILDELERWTGRSWVPRYCRLELRGSGTSVLSLRNGKPRTSDGRQLDRPGRFDSVANIIAADIGGTAVTTTDITIDGDRLLHEADSWTTGTQADPFNVTVEYEYGVPYIIDGVDRIAMKLLVDRLVPSAFPDRALSIDTDFGTTRLVQPGGPMMNVSRIPEVNDWVSRHDHRIFSDF